jgi:isopentenyl-diphosphate delta-isomerase
MLTRHPSRQSAMSNGHPSVSDNAADEVILVDADDRPVGTVAKLDAHRRGLRHRAMSVIVRDRHDRLLLQQRAAGKYHSGGLWTNTCCGHPRPGEQTIDAAGRRLAEEMGFTCPMTFLFSTHYRAAVSNDLIEDEIVHVFGGRFDGMPDPDPREVADWIWKAPDDVARDVDARPDVYTVWFRKYRRQFWDAMVG